MTPTVLKYRLAFLGFLVQTATARFEPRIAKGIEQNEVLKSPKHAMFVSFKINKSSFLFWVCSFDVSLLFTATSHKIHPFHSNIHVGRATTAEGHNSWHDPASS